tara:strand:- start:121854 stop:122855 length:1002 start_codon:yes stop_codon:yes gene_type:complete
MDNNNFEQYNEGYVSVTDGHEIYFAEHGNPNGIPLLLVHGGPGGRSYAANAAIADLDKYRVIRFDQRGTGRSKFEDQMLGQTIADQVQDIEALRNHLGVNKFVLLGGSYGSTLSTYYRIHYPENVEAHFMRALFYGDKAGAEHIAEGGGYGGAYAYHAGTESEEALVDAWQSYADYPAEISEDLAVLSLTAAYSVLLNSDDPAVVQEAGLRFDRMDTAIATVRPQADLIQALDDAPEDSVNLARLFMHYAANEFTYHSQQNMVIGLMSTDNIPTTLIHGQRDFICPVRYAQTLKGACPNIDVQIIEDAGHSMADAPLERAMKSVLQGYNTTKR